MWCFVWCFVVLLVKLGLDGFWKDLSGLLDGLLNEEKVNIYVEFESDGSSGM